MDDRSNLRFSYIIGNVFQPLKKEKEEQFEPKINEQITAPFVRPVTEEGHDVGPLERAMAQAESLGMDLVEVDMREFLNAPNGK
ncbi:hypothetical protein ACS0TY_025783 [Phlomoides rotata]